ncbi:pectin lyase fold/virulence factor [Jimgerdemannia flammicorona]|uniref:pectinesterase n=1 Tax=Jimgerdemannia flammicorona TaxID=994334 RepID=A0A433QB15_9FUNG|nr:pectin lyase fold/virulence factor [Jimgerdemannia flammicorona]
MKAASILTLLLAFGLVSLSDAQTPPGASCKTGLPNGVRVTPGNRTISAALTNLPSDGQLYTLLIESGVYNEQVWVNRSNVILRSCGTTSKKVVVQYAYGVSTSGRFSDAVTSVLLVARTNVSAYDIAFNNINPQAKNTAALALTVNFNAQHAGFYGCSFFGFQDTVLINMGSQAYFEKCYIEGSVDFIWGYGKAYFKNCTIGSNSAGYVTAHNRANATADGGFIFDHCTIKPVMSSFPALTNYTIAYANLSTAYSTRRTFLGRPYSQYARVVYLESYLDSHLNVSRWTVWNLNDTRTGNPGAYTVLFGEYMNYGPGSNSTPAAFATTLGSAAAKQFSLSSFFKNDTAWIDASARIAA